jgi:hypothetical protein
MRFSAALALASLLACAGCDAGVNFDADIVGLVFGRTGGALGAVFSVTVDFREAGRVEMFAEQSQGGTVVESAIASCDLGAAEQGLFETCVPGTGCEFASTLDDEGLPDTPDAIVLGFKNRTADAVELDPSLDEDLPSPFSFVDSYNTLSEVEPADG